MIVSPAFLSWNPWQEKIFSGSPVEFANSLLLLGGYGCTFESAEGLKAIRELPPRTGPDKRRNLAYGLLANLAMEERRNGALLAKVSRIDQHCLRLRCRFIQVAERAKCEWCIWTPNKFWCARTGATDSDR